MSMTCVADGSTVITLFPEIMVSYIESQVSSICVVFRYYKALSLCASDTKIGEWKRVSGQTPKFAVDNPWHIGLFSLMSGGSCGCGHWGLLCDFLEASIVLFFINIIGF
jgi:hypothetical protein